MVCFCSASLKILVSNRRYVIFLPRDFKIGRHQKHVWVRILREVAGADSSAMISKATMLFLNKREGQPSTVIIDFGKSVLAEKA